MDKPSFFISSTIHDFKYLRSALKYYLEEQGCQVFASEYNDFPKEVDKNTFDACLEVLNKTNYYILFIGSRIGSWYNEPERISITRQEYREAYKLHLSGKLKLILFASSEVWQLRSSIFRNHTISISDDWRPILEFMDEISREGQYVTESKPTGNWIHKFEGFRDVMDVIAAQTFMGKSIDKVVIEKLLVSELMEILRRSLVKYGQNYSPKEALKAFYLNTPIPPSFGVGLQVRVNSDEWDEFTAVSVAVMGVNLQPIILKQALVSSAFLYFDQESESFKEDPVYELIFKLNNEIIHFHNSKDSIKYIFNYTPLARGHTRGTLLIAADELLPLLFLVKRWVNIIELSKAILLRIQSQFDYVPDLQDFSPIPGKDEENKNQEANSEDVEKFLKGNK